MGFNRHTHEWGSNSKGSFCLHCGEFCEKHEEGGKDKYGFMSLPMNKRDTLMWPDKEKLTEETLKDGDNFDSWSR